jgi:hypothetical protein
MRQPRFGGVQVFRQVTIGGVQAGVMDLKDYLPGLRHRIGRIGQPETVNTLKIVNEPRFHAPK